MMRSDRARAQRTGNAALARVVLAGLLLSGTACGGESGGNGSSNSDGGARGAPPENHTTPTADSAQHPSVASATDSSACPRTGRWARCHLIKRLELAGLAADTSHEGVTEPPLTVDGTELRVRNATMELYFYPDRAARERDQARLDRSRYLEADQPPEPRHKPTLVTSENLLVVLDTRNQRQRERITLAITAGPPQPPVP